MKLSETQLTVLRLMNEGWLLSWWPLLSNCETGESHYVRTPTFDILEKRKLIERSRPDESLNHFSLYKLTDLGREAAKSAKQKAN